jgi:hypothetical protein
MPRSIIAFEDWIWTLTKLQTYFSHAFVINRGFKSPPASRDDDENDDDDDENDVVVVVSITGVGLTQPRSDMNWHPLHTPKENVFSRARKALNCARTFGWYLTTPAHPIER